MPTEVLGILLLTGLILLIRFHKLLPSLLRFLVRSTVGYLFLYFFSFFGTGMGLTLGANLVNSAVLGLLGLPGFGLLLMIRYMTL